MNQTWQFKNKFRSLVVRGGRVIDPAGGVDGSADVLVENGRIAKVGADLPSEGAKVIDAAGKIVTPGLLDMHVHLREPGQEAKEDFVSGTAGLPTLRDILAELERPGRDPRAEFEAFAFNPDVRSLSDLRPGMRLPGIVTNVTAFGAFVDIGVHQDGLIHVSRIADTYVENPHSRLKPGQQVRVAVLEIDEGRRRVSLSMRKSDLGEPGAGHETRKGY